MLGKLLQMMDAEGHQHGRHDVEARLQVVRLVVEEDVRPDGLEKRLLVEADSCSKSLRRGPGEWGVEAFSCSSR